MGAPLVKTSTPGVYKRGRFYAVRFVKPDGTKGQRAARTLKEARELRAALNADVHRGEYRELSRTTFHDYATEWARTYQGRTGRGVRVNTLAEYRRDLELHAIPFFGRRRLTEVEPRDVKRFARHLADAGLAPATVRNVMAPVRALLATAVEEGLIRSNPAAGLRLPGRKAGPEERVKALSEQELAALLAAAPDGWPRLFLRFLADTGLRIGEAIALTWQRVDLAERRVKVRERLYRGELDAPKSSYGRREVPLSPGLASALRAHRLASPFSQDGDLVFATRTGTPHRPENLRRRLLVPAALAAGLVDENGKPWPGFHTLRHTCASRLFRAGVDAKRVQLILGHHSPAFTLATYVHLLPGDLPDVAFFDLPDAGAGAS